MDGQVTLWYTHSTFPHAESRSTPRGRPGATSLGVRPTFNGHDITVEPYILDFDREIYGEQLTVTFEKRLRDELKFDSLDALIAQIGADVDESRAYLELQQANP